MEATIQDTIGVSLLPSTMNSFSFVRPPADAVLVPPRGVHLRTFGASSKVR
jgi:hypothetical protein